MKMRKPARLADPFRPCAAITAAVMLAVVSVVTTPARAAVVVELSLVVNPVTSSYQAFASVLDPSGETSGLHGLEFDITGAGGASVLSSNVSLPAPTESLDLATFYPKGFKQLRSDGTAGQDVRAFQDNVNQLSPTGSGNNNLLENVGEAAFAETNGLLPLTAVTSPVLIATGTFSGITGTLSISGSPSLTTLLPAQLPAATANGASFSTFSPAAVTGQTVAVPEPATAAAAAFLAAGIWGSSRLRRGRFSGPYTERSGVQRRTVCRTVSRSDLIA